jgi:hypothetical protein
MHARATIAIGALFVCLALKSLPGEQTRVLAKENEAKTPIKAKDDGKIKEITFDDLKFEMTKGEPFERSMLTEKIEDLVGRNIRIRGYMLPSFQQKGITQFVLVRDNLECCFGPGAALYDCVMVELKGTSATFTVKPIAVEGRFTVSEFKDPDGNHLAIYHLDGTKVK